MKTNKKSKRLVLIDKSAKTTGKVFGILFFMVIVILTAFPFGIGLDSKAYLQSAIALIYPIGLFIGLKWKGPGILVCLVSMAADMVTVFAFRSANVTFSIKTYIFYTVLYLIQMIPVTLYILSWHYHRKLKFGL